jgi:Ser/Thr protein kinase RdoA (MazF antagonist)
VNELAERCVGAPAVFEELKHKPGRRLTLRAHGPRGRAIVKLYRSDRVVTVAERIAALGTGPEEPVVPEVLAVDHQGRILILSDVRGKPFRETVLAGDERGCRRTGAAIAHWHRAWAANPPAALSEHTVERELDVLVDRAALASPPVRREVAATLPALRASWRAETVVHRDLYEEQVLVGEQIGLIDLDDAALGPPELDVGNLVAHLDLLELRSGCTLAPAKDAFLDGYASCVPLDADLLERCRLLAQLRLVCIHDEPRLLAPAKVCRSASRRSATSSATPGRNRGR